MRIAFVASPLVDVQSSTGMRAPVFFADDCLSLGCCLTHDTNCLVSTSLNLSQLRKATSFLSAFWNHSEEYFYSSMSIATYPVWILSLKGNCKWRTMCLSFPVVASDERERSNHVGNPMLRRGRFQCQVRKHSVQEHKSLLSLFPPTYRPDSDYAWRWSAGWDPPLFTISIITFKRHWQLLGCFFFFLFCRPHFWTCWETLAHNHSIWSLFKTP